MPVEISAKEIRNTDMANNRLPRIVNMDVHPDVGIVTIRVFRDLDVIWTGHDAFQAREVRPCGLDEFFSKRAFRLARPNGGSGRRHSNSVG